MGDTSGIGISFILRIFSSCCCVQDTLSSRAVLGLPAVQPLGRVRRASKGILHSNLVSAQFYGMLVKAFVFSLDWWCCIKLLG